MLGLLAGLLTLAALPVPGAVKEAWVHHYSNVVTNSNYRAAKVVRDATGDIIVVGTVYGYEMLTIKYSGVDGSLLWSRCFDGYLYEDRDGDHPYEPDVAVDVSGNVVVTVASDGYYTAKYAAASGALLWERRYNVPPNIDDAARAVAVDYSGNVVVTGISVGTNFPRFYYDCYTAKYAAADGAVLWERRHNARVSAGHRQFLAVDANDNVALAFISINTECCANPEDCYTAKYAAADGAVLWEKGYNSGSSDAISGVAVDATGNVVVTGSSGTLKYDSDDGALLWQKGGSGAVTVDGKGGVVLTADGSHTSKYAADGVLLWQSETGGFRVAVDDNDNVVVLGHSFDSGHNIILGHYTAKLAAGDGGLLWEQHYTNPADGNEGNDFPQAIVADASGNVVLTGYFYSGGNGYHCYTAKYAAAHGSLLWEQRLIGLLDNGYDVAQDAAVDASGSVVVTGSSSNGRNTDFYTAKYAADGPLLWEKRFDSGRYDEAFAVAVDSGGNVIVTGAVDNHINSTPSGGILCEGTSDYYTAKYAAADGALLWEKRYNGPGNGFDVATAMAVDDSGDAVVTGYSEGDYYTARYAAADGTLVWEKRYNGPGSGSDRASALALDGSGNVVVTGTSGNISFNTDYYTAKYAAANGALLWEKRYNGPGHDSDQPQSVVVDGSGNVVVTGYSYGSGSSIDYYTAKYAAADGALLWEKRYNGPGNDVDVATALALDSSGNAVVTGYSESDYYTAKYAAADGRLLWEKRYPGGGSHIVPSGLGCNLWVAGGSKAVEVDNSGNVVVTGTSGGNYYTAKYAAADGALLWEKRYPGGVARSLALGPYSMVVVSGSSAGDYATVVYRESLPPVSLEIVVAGVRLRFAGEPGRTYRIERARVVTGPWVTLATATAPIGGLIEYSDATPLNGSAVYRMAAP